ncbi:MAG: PIN domain-containing protein [Methylomarinum sp.]|nr:PIN domain-containing protein [Methylomarinum sp.]
MNGIKYLLDTNIILGVVAGNYAAGIKLKGIDLENCAFSSVTRMELLGFPNITQNEIKIISSLLSQMSQLTIQRTIEDKTINLKQQHRIKLPDAIILATALNHQIELLTLDKKLANKLPPLKLLP